MQNNITKMWLIISSNTTPVEVQMKFTICHIERVSYFQRFKKHIAIFVIMCHSRSSNVHFLPFWSFVHNEQVFRGLLNGSYNINNSCPAQNWGRPTVVIICDALCNLASVTFWLFYDWSNTCKCMLTVLLPSCCFYRFVWVSMTFEWVFHVSNGVSFKWVSTWQSNDVWMLLPDFKVSWQLQCNDNLHCNTSCTLEHFYLQCSLMFSLVFGMVISHYLNIY